MNQITKLRLILLAMLLLPLSGCGIISIGYNYADVYLRYTINSYASFDQEQRQFIHREVDQYMAWHRRHMLPEYVAFLRSLEVQVREGKPVQPADIALYRNHLRELYIKTLMPTIRPAAKILAGLQAGQIVEIEQALARENNKFRDKELSGSPEELLDRRAEKTLDVLQDMAGGFTDSQAEAIRVASRRLPYSTRIYFEGREENQKRLLELIRKQAGEESIAEFLAQWLGNPEMLRSEEDRQTVLAFEQASDTFIAEVYAQLNEKQKRKLVKYIEKYSNVFADLAANI